MHLVHIHYLILCKIWGWDCRSCYFSCLCFLFPLQLAYVALVLKKRIPKKKKNTIISKVKRVSLQTQYVFWSYVSSQSASKQSYFSWLLLLFSFPWCRYHVDTRQIYNYSSSVQHVYYFHHGSSRWVSCGQPWKNNEAAHQHCCRVKQEMKG